MLIEIDDDIVVNLALIRKIERVGPHQDRRFRVTWSDGSSEALDDFDGGLISNVGQFVPASYGFSRVVAVEEGDGSVSFRDPMPVVAFNISVEAGMVLPIALDGDLKISSRDRAALVLPDGSCFDFEHSSIHQDVTAWKAFATSLFVEDRRRLRERA